MAMQAHTRPVSTSRYQPQPPPLRPTFARRLYFFDEAGGPQIVHIPLDAEYKPVALAAVGVNRRVVDLDHEGRAIGCIFRVGDSV